MFRSAYLPSFYSHHHQHSLFFFKLACLLLKPCLTCSKAPVLFKIKSVPADHVFIQRLQKLFISQKRI